MTIQTDVVIIGGGLVGSAMGLALAQQGISTHIVEHSNRKTALDATFDGRSSAISEASRRVLNSVGVWDDIMPDAEAILDIRAVNEYSSALVHYDHTELGNTPFGYIVPNTSTRKALLEKAEAQDRLEVHYEVSADVLERDDNQVNVKLSDGTNITAKLLLAADGRFSKTRDWAGISHRTIEYGQTAIVCTIRHSNPHEGLALERFLPAGPFAVLPMTNNRSCIVWTETDDMADYYKNLDEEAFLFELKQRAGEWLGNIWLEGKIFSYPLMLIQADSYISQRVALIGDAAHGIHPIAGQGVNLGYRDVAVLAECIAQTTAQGLDIGEAVNLEHYQRWRNFDATSVSFVMDGINRLFSNNIPPIRAARSLGLRAVEKTPSLKGFFMMHSMGLLGDLPPMLKDKCG